MNFTAIHHLDQRIEDVSFRRFPGKPDWRLVYWGEQLIGQAFCDARRRCWDVLLLSPSQAYGQSNPTIQGLADRHAVAGWLLRKSGIWCDTASGAEETRYDLALGQQVSTCPHRAH